MVFDIQRQLLALSFVVLGCASAQRPRFPIDRPPLWKDDDRRPFVTQCAPDPEEPGHRLCTPETYVSPFAWDAADNTVFGPVARTFAVDTAGEAVNVNSFDEVPDSSWFENRIGRATLTPEEVVAGPCGSRVLKPEAATQNWVIDQGKPNGANPGFRVRVEQVDKFMLKSDLLDEPERATAAAAIAARLYWAFGFHSPCDSVVYFPPSRLQLKPGLMVTDNSGVSKPFDERALQRLLSNAAHRGELVRMSASRWLPGRTIGPFRYEGVREDDPNDVVPHQNRRELRGARLLAAWLNHFDSREQNTMNTWLPENEKDADSTPGHIQHWYIDFGDCFGSQWDLDGISRRLGHAYYLDFGYMAGDFVTFGLITRPWDKARIAREAPIFGYYSANDFKADAWRGGYPNPAFDRMSESDGAWAARIIARFTPEHVAAVVATADLSNPRHTQYLTRTLIARQRLLLQRYLSHLSPISDVRVQGGEVCAFDLARASGAFSKGAFQYRARLYWGEAVHELPAPAVRSEPSGLVCVRVPQRAAAGLSRADLQRYFVLDVYNGNAEGPLRIHGYDLGAEGLQLAGLERPEGEEAPAL